MVGLVVLLLGCAGSIQPLYEAERDAALAVAGPAGPGWRGDTWLRLRPEGLQTVVEAALESGLASWEKELRLDGPLGASVALRPQASVQGLQLSIADCEGCLSLTADLKGSAGWDAGLVDGSVPFTAKIGGKALFFIEQQDGAFVVKGRLLSVEAVQLSDIVAARLDATERLRKWVDNALQKTPTFTLATLGSEGLPLRGARLASGQRSLDVEILTDIPGVPALPAPTDALGQDWELRIGATSALALARRAAFEAGTLSHDVAVDPRSLAVDGDAFTLNLRLWRLAGKGWWRDYSVTGRLAVEDKQLRIVPTDAIEYDKSRGAGFVDPLVALVDGQILKAIEKNMHQLLPASQTAAVGRRKVGAAVQDLRGEDGALVVRGNLTLE